MTVLQYVLVYVYHHQGVKIPKLKATAGGVILLQCMVTDVSIIIVTVCVKGVSGSGFLFKHLLTF
jgi:hypothetical protein